MLRLNLCCASGREKDTSTQCRMSLNYNYNPNRISGIRSVKLALAENIYYDPSPFQTEVAQFMWATSEQWFAQWSAIDQLEGELQVEETQLDGDTIDKYTVKLTFRDNAQAHIDFASFANTYFRGRLLAIELMLENGTTTKLVPMVCNYKYVVPNERGNANYHELTFVRAKSIDAFASLILDEIVDVQLNCVSRLTTITMKNPTEGYEFGVSLYEDINTVINWTLNEEIIMPDGNGLVFVFVRIAGEQNGIYKSSRFFVNCEYLGARLQILDVTSQVDYTSLVTFWEDVVTSGEDVPDPLQADWEDISTTGDSSEIVCRLQILDVVLT